MIRNCLEQGHWYSGSLLRDVDECVDLAQYFSITKGSNSGEVTRLRWFRQNVSPSHATCREAISAWQSLLVGTEVADQHLEVMKELYRKKSKWTHPTYKVIREISSFDTDGKITLAFVDYGPCSYERKIFELAEFFRSSIWSTFQCLWLCFKLEFPLADEDVSLLRDYDRMFQDGTDGT